MGQVALGIVYCASQHAILMLERADFACGVRWAFPGGKIRRGERPYRAALREVREETGVRAKLARPITFREHPVTKAPIHYFFLEEVDETPAACNAEAHKHLSVQWWSPQKVVDHFGDELAPQVLERLMFLSSIATGRALGAFEPLAEPA